jgi:hypothetical protein
MPQWKSRSSQSSPQTRQISGPNWRARFEPPRLVRFDDPTILPAVQAASVAAGRAGDLEDGNQYMFGQATR